MNIQNNLMALQAHGQMKLNSLALQTSLQKLSSGYRINSAADDAAGLAISERIRAQATGLERSMLNAQDGMSLVQTAEGGLNEVHSMLNRLTDLAGQAANGVLNASQRQSIQKEVDSILNEIDRVSKATNFNGIKLLDGSLSGQGSNQVAVSGVSVTETAGTAGVYDYSAMPGVTGLAAGDTINFSMALNNGTSQNFTFTMNEGLGSMTAQDGTVYSFASSSGGSISGADFAAAVAGQLRGSAAGQSFAVSSSGGGLTLTSREADTAAPQIRGVSYQVNNGGYQSITGSITAPTDDRADIAKESLSIFDGTNQSSATFTVNGQKFALVSENGFANTVGKYQGDVNFIKVSANTGAGLTADDLSSIAASVNQKTGLAFQGNADGIQVKAQTGGEGVKLQVGSDASPYNMINVGIGNMSVAGLGLRGLDLTSQEGASRALSRISSAIDTVSGTRADLGATQNRLEYTINNLGVTYENITASESRIRDVDMAKELMNFTRRQILNQVSQAMLGQANAQSAQVLQLLK